MSHPSENLPHSVPPSLSSEHEYSHDEHSSLLRLAHASIESAIRAQEIAFEAPTPHLAEKRGAFTTLYVRGELRGCVGYVFPVSPLYRTIAETARAAAFEDVRFPPLTAEELPELEVHLSVLSVLQPIRAEEVQVGRHGLLVSLDARRGLLLPQVPVEHGWDRETFLEQTCRKAGLPLDAWRHGATLEAFTAELFGDRDV
jgi:AmmeMemoRadiSam system protein A